MIYTSKELNLKFEAIADIALLCGNRGYYSGDSRADIQQMIYWADQFVQLHQYTDWEEKDYMIEIENFTEMKLKESKAQLFDGGIAFYSELIKSAPEYNDVMTAPVRCVNGDCAVCEPGEENFHTVYLCLLDGRKMAVADTNNPQIAEQLKQLLQNGRNRQLS